VNRHAHGRQPDDQPVLALQPIPPAVERARSVRRGLGLAESLVAPDVLLNVRAILESSAYRGHRPTGNGARKAS
jgi:hypothetical protein